ARNSMSHMVKKAFLISENRTPPQPNRSGARRSFVPVNITPGSKFLSGVGISYSAFARTLSRGPQLRRRGESVVTFLPGARTTGRAAWAGLSLAPLEAHGCVHSDCVQVASTRRRHQRRRGGVYVA